MLNLRRGQLSLVGVLVAATGLAGCSDAADDKPAPTQASETSVVVEQPNPVEGTPPTPDAEQANNDFVVVPNGVLDCGVSILTSGWPTTTVFVTEIEAECILAAAQSGEAAQYTSWGRDNLGGIDGTIIRVDGPATITSIDYHIDSQGNLTSTETTCPELTTESFEPPVCSDT